MTDLTVLLAVAALAGLIIGSFLNVCIYRLPRDLSVVWPGSHCIACRNPIAPYDNIPLFSYIALRARCRHCRTAISWRYPLTEGATAALFVAIAVTWGADLKTVRNCVFAALCVGMILSDWETRILPDEFTLGGLWAGLAFSLVVPLDAGIFDLLLWSYPAALTSILDSALAAALLAGSLWSVGVLYERVRGKEGLGFGDVKMAAMLGAFLGLPAAIFGIFVGCVSGTVVGVTWIYLMKKDAGTFALPFGSFLGAGALLALFWVR
jgi:leader peptidase (prepilin peptidase)/N-methyltransferase